MKNDLVKAMKAAIAHMNRWMDRHSGKPVRLFHHNDSDGLSSGAILSRAFERHGVKVQRCCLEGVSDASDQMLAGLRTIQHHAFEKEANKIAKGTMHITPHIQWVHVEDRFAPMGVKMIGVFLSSIRNQVENQQDLSPEKYLAGFQVVPNEVPGFGRVAINQVKISMRVCTSLAAKIRAGASSGMDTFLPEATRRVDGFSDACHSLAAATTIDIGREEALISEMEKILSGR